MTRAQIIQRMQEICDECERLARFPSLTAAQQRSLADLEAEFDRLDGDRLAMDVQASRTALDVARSLRGGGNLRTEDGAHREPDHRAPAGSRRARAAGVGEQRGRALDVLDSIERSSDHLGRGQLDTVATLVGGDDGDLAARYVRATGNPDYLRAFAALVRNPQLGSHEWTEPQRAAFAEVQSLQRALAVGSPSTGGVMLPLQLDPSIILSNGGTSNTSLRNVFTVKTVITDSWHGVTSAGVSAHWRPESGEADDDTPAVAEAVVPVHRGDAFIPASIEVTQDAPNFAAEMAKLLADGKERLEAQAFITGTGTGQPRGIVTAAVTAGKTVTSTLADTLAAGDVYKTKAALPPRWRANARWLMADPTVDAVRQMSADQTQPMLDGANLAGRPFTETSELDGVIDAGQSNYLAVFGDLRQYVVADRVGTSIELVPHLFGTNRRPLGQRGFFMFFRTGGDLVVPDSVRVLNV